MPLPVWGNSISLSQIQTEFGGANPIGLNEYYAGGPYVPAGTYGYPNNVRTAIPTSGTISLNNFFGAAKGLLVRINSNQNYTVPAGYRRVTGVAVGGGGTGGVGACSAGEGGGGGGSGGVNISTRNVSPGQVLGITIGAGGYWTIPTTGTNGQRYRGHAATNTTITLPSQSSIVGNAGGIGGGFYPYWGPYNEGTGWYLPYSNFKISPTTGGSGGGGMGYNGSVNGASGTSGQGYAGGRGNENGASGGGGGGGAAGTSPHGGAGRSFSLGPNSLVIAGGGGAGAGGWSSTRGNGGSGGGAMGGARNGNGSSAGANTGGGGGGSGDVSGNLFGNAFNFTWFKKPGNGGSGTAWLWFHS